MKKRLGNAKVSALLVEKREKAHRIRHVGDPKKMDKPEDQICSSSLQKQHNPDDSLMLIQSDPLQSSDLQNCQIHLWCFKPHLCLFVAICYSIHSKQIEEPSLRFSAHPKPGAQTWFIRSGFHDATIPMATPARIPLYLFAKTDLRTTESLPWHDQHLPHPNHANTGTQPIFGRMVRTTARETTERASHPARSPTPGPCCARRRNCLPRGPS